MHLRQDYKENNNTFKIQLMLLRMKAIETILMDN